MDVDDVEGVFGLVTKLCEQFSNDPDEVKLLRTKSYEIVLGKRLPKCKNAHKDLKGSKSSNVTLLSWVFQLTHVHELRDHAEKLKQVAEIVRLRYIDDPDTFNNILQFLLCFKKLPTRDVNQWDLSTLPSLNFNVEWQKVDNIFKLPYAIKKQCNNYFSDSFSPQSMYLDQFNFPKRIQLQSGIQSAVRDHIEVDTVLFEDSEDEGISEPENIWEMAARAPFCARGTWENFGYYEPDKEPPFLSELGDLASLWVDNLESLYAVSLFKQGKVIKSRLVPRKVFIKDLKYLLAGMASDCFSFDDNGEFYLNQNIGIEGVTPDTLQTYCKDLLFCGTCHKALSRMCTPNPETGKYKHEGHIFTEFCGSIKRYLQYHETAVFSISGTVNYLEFHEKTSQLRLQHSAVASICKVGPYAKKDEEMPKGVALLNYLYQKVMNVAERKVVLVLYSILYPCCQIYFRRFLTQWILEGVINDPYGEFFIKIDYKYVLTRGRTYWTRSYSICEDIMPDFLIDLKNDILFCGKAMTLLKLSNSSSKLCQYVMGTKPSIISCCLTRDQLSALYQGTITYFLEVSAEIGPQFKIADVVAKYKCDDPAFLALVAKKRAATLRRIELEKLKVIEEQKIKRIEEINILKEHYNMALEQVQLNLVKDIQEEMKHLQENIEIEEKRQKLIKEEADRMIEHYTKLYMLADKRKAQIENHIKVVKNIQIDQNTNLEKGINDHCQGPENSAANSSSDSFYSVHEEGDKDKEIEDEHFHDSVTHMTMHTSESLDILNANVEDNQEVNEMKIENAGSTYMQEVIDNFNVAKKIKQKVLTEELGIIITKEMNDSSNIEVTHIGNAPYMTDAQKNKLRVLSSEFGIEIKDTRRIIRLSKAAQSTKDKVLGTSDCFRTNQLDNANYLNRNVDEPMRKSKSLSLDFNKLSVKSVKPEYKPIPMSVDSTPQSEMPPTPSTACIIVDNTPTTARTEHDLLYQDGFSFDTNQTRPVYIGEEKSNLPKMVFSKRVTTDVVRGTSTNCLSLFLKESIQIPLTAQLRMVNDELLRYFISDLKYLDHLQSLRNYFFLLDGEFGRNVTETLFAKLYESPFPSDIINYRMLKELLYRAFDASTKNQENSQRLSFRMNGVPKCFDLGDPNILDFISLTYKVQWPLNILLPTDTIAKYDEVFRFLLKLHRVGWVLKMMFLEMKSLAKQVGQKEIYLMSSPHYRRLHQCRHIMTHFIQTLQDYIIGEVLQSSWDAFEKKLVDVSNLDELYAAHVSYVKKIIILCMLHQKLAALKTVIHKIFVVVLKFYDYLRSRLWKCEDGVYVHPNFEKLDSIFKNFEDVVAFFLKVARKVGKCGLQPHLLQFLDRLNINDYYS